MAGGIDGLSPGRRAGCRNPCPLRGFRLATLAAGHRAGRLVRLGPGRHRRAAARWRRVDPLLSEELAGGRAVRGRRGADAGDAQRSVLVRLGPQVQGLPPRIALLAPLPSGPRGTTRRPGPTRPGRGRTGSEIPSPTAPPPGTPRTRRRCGGRPRTPPPSTSSWRRADGSPGPWPPAARCCPRIRHACRGRGPGPSGPSSRSRMPNRASVGLESPHRGAPEHQGAHLPRRGRPQGAAVRAGGPRRRGVGVRRRLIGVAEEALPLFLEACDMGRVQDLYPVRSRHPPRPGRRGGRRGRARLGLGLRRHHFPKVSSPPEEAGGRVPRWIG